MRINKFIAAASGLSRRKADEAITMGRISVNGRPAAQGQEVTEQDIVTLDGRRIMPPGHTTTVMLNKPAGFVVSRAGQGSRTVYDLLPPEYHALKPIDRLDKDSSGLLLLTDDGNLAHDLTHPSRQKAKLYEVTLDKPLQPLHHQMITGNGVQLDDGPSKFALERLKQADDQAWLVTMHEGRNRQIRRTFAALGYAVIGLRRIQFGDYRLDDLPAGTWQPSDR